MLAITRDLLRELGNDAAIEGLTGSANLECDLRLGSVERLELMSRLERTLGASLPESAFAEAKSLDDIIAVVTSPPGSRGVNATEEAPAESLSRAAGDFEEIESSSSRSSPKGSGLAGAEAINERAGLLARVWETSYGIYAATVFFVWLVLAWLVLLLMPSGRAAARMTSAALRFYFRLIGCQIHMEGRENVEAHGASIYVSNHTSYSDVLAVLALFPPNYHFVAKSEINQMPFIGTFLRKLGHFAFERNKLRSRSRQVEQMEKALLRGESVFVFAEGTFTAQPGVRPFQLGAFRAAVKTGRPIVPVALRGTRRFLQDGTFLPKPSRIIVTVGPLLIPNPAPGGREWAEVLRLRDETRRIISSHSGEPLLHTSES